MRFAGERDLTEDVGATPLSFSQIAEALGQVLGNSETGAVDAVDLLVAQALCHRASDVHVEPWADCVAVRFRVDGILHDVATLPKKHQMRIVARLKVLAKLVVYQRDIPQEGRIDGEASASGQTLRVSTFPTIHGEKIVVRVFEATRKELGLDQLGFSPQIAQTLRDLIMRPQGTLLLTGPSSSGKTTTIYALLKAILTEGGAVHIVTIEDPVEHRLRQVGQTQINPAAGLTFDVALRSALRQDPEVIMVGEIRDAETARTAIQAGLTGHRVISTIHSGTAAGVFTRLIDMGVEPFLIVSSVVGVLAQRLVRLNCPHCAAPYMPAPELVARFGLADTEDRLRQGRGCDACEGIGYHERTAIGELLMVNEDIANLVLERLRTRVLHEAAVRNHMRTLDDDGLDRALAGLTTLEELKRVLPPKEVS